MCNWSWFAVLVDNKLIFASYVEFAFQNWPTSSGSDCLEVSLGWKRETPSTVLTELWFWDSLVVTQRDVSAPAPPVSIAHTWTAPRGPDASIVITVRCSYSVNLSKVFAQYFRDNDVNLEFFTCEFSDFLIILLFIFLAFEWLLGWLICVNLY